jgi:perosamine synthetase
MKKIINKRIFGNELKYLKEVIRNEFCTSSGAKMMNLLENKFAKIFQSKHAISFVNGTATMHAALEAMGIGKNDEVIVPPLTMSSTAFAVLQANATPVFADIDPETFLIDPGSIKKLINKKTKAIITVALYGLSPDIDKIKKFSNKIKIIEDNAECFLGKYKNKLVGTLGDCASFSFQSSKHITSGEGGMIITSNETLANNIRKVQSLGYMGLSSKKSKIDKNKLLNPYYDRHYCLGWNYRMSELCSAVALGQLENINALVSRRIEVAKLFQKQSRLYHNWFVPQKIPNNCRHSYWTWAVKLETNKISWDDFTNKFKYFGGDNIYAAWKLSYQEPAFKNLRFLGREKFISKKNKISYFKKNLCPNAEYIQPRILQFKTNYWNIKDMHKQADVLKKTLKFFGKKP